MQQSVAPPPLPPAPPLSSSPSSRKPSSLAKKIAAKYRPPVTYRLLKKLNPYYCLLIVLTLYAIMWLRGRPLHHMFGRDVNIDSIEIIDGDTFTAATVPDGVFAKFRLKQVDAPERDQPFHAQAARALSELLIAKDREVIVFLWEQDDWGRYVVDVVTRDSVFTRLVYVQEEMARKGMVWAFGTVDKKSSLYVAMEHARESKIGLWSQEEPVEPWRHRRMKRNKGKPTPTSRRKPSSSSDPYRSGGGRSSPSPHPRGSRKYHAGKRPR